MEVFRSEAGTVGFAPEVVCLLVGLAAAQCLLGGTGDPFRPSVLAVGLGTGEILAFAFGLGCAARRRRCAH